MLTTCKLQLKTAVIAAIVAAAASCFLTPSFGASAQAAKTCADMHLFCTSSIAGSSLPPLNSSLTAVFKNYRDVAGSNPAAAIKAIPTSGFLFDGPERAVTQLNVTVKSAKAGELCGAADESGQRTGSYSKLYPDAFSAPAPFLKKYYSLISYLSGRGPHALGSCDLTAAAARFFFFTGVNQ